MNPKKTIVFDFGAVLFDWQPRVFMRRLLPEHATDEASAAHWVHQIFQNYGGDWGEFDRGVVQEDELAERIATRTGLERTRVRALIDLVPLELEPLPDSVALLAQLRNQGHRLVFLSNMPAPYARLLERENAFIAWFEDGVFSADVKHIKPEPAIFEVALKRFGGAAQDLVFLDDLARNVAQAQAMGWNALRFHNAAQAQADLKAHGWMA